MGLDEELRERIVLLGGVVAGVDCPDCRFESREVDIDPRTDDAVRCPECGTMILDTADKRRLELAHKL